MSTVNVDGIAGSRRIHSPSRLSSSKVGGHLAHSVHSSNELNSCNDLPRYSTINIILVVTTTIIITIIIIIIH